jgi:hypothetical protein
MCSGLAVFLAAFGVVATACSGGGSSGNVGGEGGVATSGGVSGGEAQAGFGGTSESSKDAAVLDAPTSDSAPNSVDPTVLVNLGFNTASDLKRLKIDDSPGAVVVEAGVLKFEPFANHTAIVDDQPDATPTNVFDLAQGDLVISMKVQSNSTPIVPSPALVSSVLPKVWISFFAQSGRKEVPRVSFSWNEVSNDGFLFVPGTDLDSPRGAGSTDPKITKARSVLTPMIPDERFYDFRVSLHLVSPGVVRAVASAYDGARLVLRDFFDFKLAKTSGEIAFGAFADKAAPLLVDDFTIRRATADEPIAPQMVYDTTGPVHVWIPPGVTKVKGVYIDSPGCCGDSNGVWDYRPYLMNFARTYDLAVLAHVTGQSATLVESGLRDLAEKSGHPELTTVPIVIYGFSAGSNWASSFTSKFASRVVAYVADAASKPTEVDMAARGVPGIFTVGDSNDYTPIDVMRSSFESVRTANTHLAVLFKEKFAHLEMGSFFLYMPFFVRALDARSPDRTLPLLPVDESKAYVIETDTLNPPDVLNPAPMAKIFPAAGYAGGPINKTGWLLDKEVATVAAAYGTYRRAVHITPMYDAVAGESRTVTVRVLPTMSNWTKIELYDFATLVKTFEPGTSPTKFNYANLSKGVHTIIAHMTHAGKVYTSFPQTFVVTPN